MFNKPSLLILIFIIMYCLTFFSSCKEDTKDPIDLVGTFTWNEWQNKSGWKNHSANDYTPDSNCVEALKTTIEACINLNFEIYASNWCHKDCETQLPRIIKFLKKAGVSEDNIIIYGLNRSKNEPIYAINKWYAAFPNENCYVPTLLVYIGENVINKVKCETSDFPDWQCNISLFSN